MMWGWGSAFFARKARSSRENTIGAIGSAGWRIRASPALRFRPLERFLESKRGPNQVLNPIRSNRRWVTPKVRVESPDARVYLDEDACPQ